MKWADFGNWAIFMDNLVFLLEGQGNQRRYF